MTEGVGWRGSSHAPGQVIGGGETAARNLSCRDATLRQQQRICVNCSDIYRPPSQADIPANWEVVPSRSEEHTSELQSLMRISYAVFCLKKKNKKRTQHSIASYNTYHIYNTKYTTPMTRIRQ